MSGDSFGNEDPRVHVAAAAIHMLDRLVACDPMAAGLVAAETLECVSAGSPIVSLWNVREDAEFWASVANPIEIECYFAACLREISSRNLALPARKRLFAALWESLPASDRSTFARRIGAAPKQQVTNAG